MANERRIAAYRRDLGVVFGRHLATRDGVAESRLRRAEKRLGTTLPSAVREFYSVAGAARETREHNRLYLPEDLVIEEGRLIFMEENQAVVDWAVSVGSRPKADPEVWQRVNEDDAPWYSEGMTFAEFIIKNLAWQRGIEL
jgi:hypothetical protein